MKIYTVWSEVGGRLNLEGSYLEAEAAAELVRWLYARVNPLGYRVHVLCHGGGRS